ncbi:MAG: (Fe-S)-binding protein [Proteobacteria bacterium]|nr:(Fe-S)-binding protein [Pseudomonadota bacterium]
MPAGQRKPVDKKKIKALLDQHKGKIQLSLAACASCSLCAESCFLYTGNNRDPHYMPSYKWISSLGTIYRKRGNVDSTFLEKTQDSIWKNCMLCMRCYCPFGIDIPGLIALARGIYRSQGFYGMYPYTVGAPEACGSHTTDESSTQETGAADAGTGK